MGWNLELPHGQTVTGMPIIHPTGNQGSCYEHMRDRAQGDGGAETHIGQLATRMSGIA